MKYSSNKTNKTNSQRRGFNKTHFNIGALVMIGFSIVIQIITIGRYLDNSVLSSYAPDYIDAAEYSERALSWQNAGFTASFEDLWRMPGYPALILFFQSIFASQPYLLLRMLQVICLAISVGLIKIILEKLTSKRVSIVISLIYALLPIWHFVPILIPESLTQFFVVLLVLTLIKYNQDSFSNHYVFGIIIIVVISAYLKPNNLILLLPISVFIYIKLRKKTIKYLVSIYLSVGIMLLPWISFANKSQPDFFGLTTTLGVNLYIGTGMIETPGNAVLMNSGKMCNIGPENNPEHILEIQKDSRVEQNRILTNKAIEIWRKNPSGQACHAWNKIMFAFGFKANDLAGFVLGFYNFLSILAALLITYSSKFRIWGITTLVAAVALAFQSAVFQADRRFILTIFYPFTILSIGILLHLYAKKLINQIIYLKNKMKRARF